MRDAAVHELNELVQNDFLVRLARFAHGTDEDDPRQTLSLAGSNPPSFSAESPPPLLFLSKS